MKWHMGDILDRVGELEPRSRPALIHGDRVVSWAELTRRSNNIARNLHDVGVTPGTKVAFYMRNRPEYLELLVAALKGRFTHVNINYRYRAQELAYILDNSDAGVVAYATEFRPLVEAVRETCPRVSHWIEVGDDPAPADAVAFEPLAETGPGTPLDIVRDGDDPILVYTGGTTGMPKGVIWTHDLMLRAQLAGLIDASGATPGNVDEFMAYARERGMKIVQLPTPPLMHLTGMGTALIALLGGGAVVTTSSEGGFRADDVWDAVARHGVTNMAIVGDTFAKPLLAALEAAPGRYDTGSLGMIISSGVMWSTPVKEAMLRHLPTTTFVDALASSEAPSMAATVSTRDTGAGATLDFRVGPECKVFDEHDIEVEPGSGRVGFVARSGIMPVGYYKDEKKTAETFRLIDGVRYVITGDMCRVEADGRITLLGRNSACINTGGEKVFAEEVEETLKEYPGVEDATVVGVPDDRWGQAVIGVVAWRDPDSFDEQALRDFVRSRLADYKTPKRVFAKDSLERFPNGKANYDRMRAFALTSMSPAG